MVHDLIHLQFPQLFSAGDRRVIYALVATPMLRGAALLLMSDERTADACVRLLGVAARALPHRPARLRSRAARGGPNAPPPPRPFVFYAGNHAAQESGTALRSLGRPAGGGRTRSRAHRRRPIRTPASASRAAAASVRFHGYAAGRRTRSRYRVRRRLRTPGARRRIRLADARGGGVGNARDRQRRPRCRRSCARTPRRSRPTMRSAAGDARLDLVGEPRAFSASRRRGPHRFARVYLGPVCGRHGRGVS